MSKFRLIRQALLAAAGLCLAFQAAAGWYTAQGSAAILDGNIAAARNEAVNDAIRNVLLQRGADVNIEQRFENGVLTGNAVSIRSKAPVRRVNVIEEQKTHNKVTVTVKVLLDDEQIPQKCTDSKIRKSILPMAFRFADQTAYQSSAGIEGISRELDNQIYSQLARSPSMLVRPVNNGRIREPGQYNSSPAVAQQAVRAVAQQNDSQYVIIGSIDTVAASEVGSNPIARAFYSRTRSINFHISIYDIFAEEEIFSQSYSAESDWDFKQGEFVDLRSDRFRGSSYGQRVKALCDRAVEDILQSMQCRKPSARVIEVEGDDFIVNIGRENGITKGTEFSLIQRYDGYGRNGEVYDKLNDTAGKYKVVEVFAHAARLRPVSLHHNVLNVRIDDIVTLL